ncbi:MAG: 30S ribosomal protein S6 [Candidatus Brocadiae bacterium]|nr:30S ribosomal protein S6 [Candidatus Brocadiia bacterium]
MKLGKGKHSYEGMFMLDPTKASQEWDSLKKQITEMIERRAGSVLHSRKWGEKKLAYEIKGNKRATYLLMYFEMPPENVNVLRRDLQLSEIVMRTLIIVQNNPKAEQEKFLSEKEDASQEATDPNALADAQNQEKSDK